MKTFLLFCLAAIINSAYSQNAWEWNTIKQGQYAAGYKTVSVKNYGKPYDTKPLQPRILPIHIWYPAIKNTGKPVVFNEYVKNDKNISQQKESNQLLIELVAQYTDSSKAKAVAEKIISFKTKAIKDAVPANQKFPVVLIGNGLTSAGYMYTLLAEYLASHGYVVVSFPSMPETGQQGFAFNERALLNQVSDMEIVVNETGRQNFADVNKLALAAWSVGGASQVLYQMKYKSAKAMISLDAATQYKYGWDLIRNSIYYDSSAIATPFLQLTAAGPARYVVERSPAFYDSLVINKKAISFPGINHSQMLSFVQLINSAEKGKEYYAEEYEKMCSGILLFLKLNCK